MILDYINAGEFESIRQLRDLGQAGSNERISELYLFYPLVGNE